MTDTIRAMAIAAVVVIGATAAKPALADNAMKVCGARYQTAKTAKTLPAGQTWNQFLAQCRGTVAKSATPTSTAKPATRGQPSPAQTAMRARQQQCATQWKADKAANKIPTGQKWPQYWGACSKRLKG